MTDGPECLGFENPLEIELKERLTLVQAQLLTHLSLRSNRVAGATPEDLAHEVVARALLYRDKFDANRALWPWLRQVAQRVIIDHRASGARRAEEPLEGDVADSARVPHLDSRDELDRALASLRSVEREALLRFHQKAESVREIAAAMNLPEGTVKSHLSRARRRLAELPNQELNHE